MVAVPTQLMPHEVELTGFGRQHAYPLIVQRTEQDFLAATIADAENDALTPITPSVNPDTRMSELRVFQPVHRTFNVALVELSCDEYGVPPLDPKKIDSAGIVVRRVQKTNLDSKNGAPMACNEGWMSSKGALKGWMSLEPSAEDLDPDPTKRPEPYHAGTPALLALLRKAAAPPMSEATTSLFAITPDARAKIGRTLMYAVVPCSSSERTEASDSMAEQKRHQYDPQDVADQMPPFFKQSTGWRNDTIGGEKWAAKSDPSDGSVRGLDSVDQQVARTDIGSIDNKISKYVDNLRKIQIQYDLFGDDGAELRAAIEHLRVYYDTAKHTDKIGRPAIDHLREACDRLVSSTEQPPVNPPSGWTPSTPSPSWFRMPTRWGAVSKDEAGAISKAVTKTLTAHLNAFLAPEGRFDDVNARYVVRAFARIKRDDGCPPKLIWSDPTPPFQIVPWFETGPTPPPVVVMPEVTPGNIRKFKPNVAFKMPSSLFDFLNKNAPKDLLAGQGSQGGDNGFDWICGFNIPIITLCAFIVLYIFLQLLNIVFWWMAFIKICIPIPRRLKI